MAETFEISLRDTFLKDKDNNFEFYNNIMRKIKLISKIDNSEELLHDFLLKAIFKDEEEKKIQVHNNEIENSVLKYLIKSIKNLDIDHLRKNKFETILDEDFDQFCNKNLLNEKTPFHDLAVKEIPKILEKEINSLEEKLRKVIQLKYLENTESKIASILNIPLGTVKSRMSKARNILKEKILLRDALEQSVFPNFLTFARRQEKESNIIEIHEIFDFIK